MALVGTILWGIIGYFSMPQRKDPDIPVTSALVITPWPGMDAERIEERITRRIEEIVAENSHVDVIRSTTRTGVVVRLRRAQGRARPRPARSSTTSRSSSTPSRTFPTAPGRSSSSRISAAPRALMLTVASPRLDEVQVVAPRRPGARRRSSGCAPSRPAGERVTLVYNFPPSISAASVVRPTHALSRRGGQPGCVPGCAADRGAASSSASTE